MRPDALRRRRTIIKQARRVFAAHGGGVALEAVAEASGVGIATLYRNFPSREELVHAVIEDMVQQILEIAAEVRDQVEADPAGGWTSLVTALTDMELGALTDSLGEQSGAKPSRTSSLVLVQQPALDALDELVSSLKRTGTIRTSITGLGLVVAIATITRPQVAAIREAAPDIPQQLVQAYVRWSTAG